MIRRARKTPYAPLPAARCPDAGRAEKREHIILHLGAPDPVRRHPADRDQIPEEPAEQIDGVDALVQEADVSAWISLRTRAPDEAGDTGDQDTHVASSCGVRDSGHGVSTASLSYLQVSVKHRVF